MLVPAAGLTVILGPVPAEVPPHEAVNHSHIAPVPKVPPETVSVLSVPKQVLLLVMLIEVGAVELVLTVTIALPIITVFPPALVPLTV